MKNLFKAFLFKTRHDLAFKITLLIGVGLAILLSLLYWGIGEMAGGKIISGQMMLYASLSPVQNFGIAIPVNLITYTVLEFSQGSIRNKVIGGHSKSKIYTSLFLNGLVFTFILIGVYASLCFGLGCAFGGFSPNGTAGILAGETADYFLGKIILIAIFSYISIVSFTIFFAALFRNIGPSIPVIIVGLTIAYLAGTFISLLGEMNPNIVWVARIIDPLYGLGCTEMKYVDETTSYQVITNETLVSSIISNSVYAALFFFGGLFIFKKRDIK